MLDDRINGVHAPHEVAPFRTGECSRRFTQKLHTQGMLQFAGEDYLQPAVACESFLRVCRMECMIHSLEEALSINELLRVLRDHHHAGLKDAPINIL